jgi:hypothetical protein
MVSASKEIDAPEGRKFSMATVVRLGQGLKLMLKHAYDSGVRPPQTGTRLATALSVHQSSDKRVGHL